MFLVPADAAGLTVGRHLQTLDRSMVGGHCEVLFDDVRVPEDAVLGEVDRGFEYAQVRLGPARMTHVMRWLGAALRGHDTALAHVVERRAFGSALGDLGMIQNMVADNEIDIAATRALLVRACWETGSGLCRRGCDVDRQDLRRRGHLPHRRPQHADVRRARRHRGSAAGAALP